ncbi:cytochrome P450 [Sagittula stellata]|uniref:Cytochrome P450 family protein n=1 Tax=Sagittula stellata (strain ATCC 700073 / DSM 11524 / E-37) TaxID=388399 RepID=A3K793_SAGS3|nr:cytochrome P450 [Sagittula stellata]EBA06852.1 cytochrome P450 family protein [Sagittula stellata E-37]
MTTTEQTRPRTRIDLADAGLWQDGPPQAEFARLRAETPVAWNERHDGHRGFWAVTRYDDIVAVSKDTETYSSRNGVISLDDFDDAQNDKRRTLLEMDPPQHGKMRMITLPGFTRRGVGGLEADVRNRVAALLDDLAGTGSFEAVETLTKQVPIITLCSLLGIPTDRTKDLIRWSDMLIGSDDPDFVDPIVDQYSEAERRMMPFGHPAALQAFEMGRELASDRRANPREDVITMLVQAQVDGRPLTEDEFLNYFLMLVVAGNETTRHTMSHGLRALADHPGEWDRFRAGGIKSQTATDEILRWASPVHFVRRIATRNMALAGAEIATGDKVAMYFTSGNRDEAHFDAPDRFDIGRARNPHMAFGKGGPHFCLGNFVAQLQIRVLIEELATRVARIETTGRVDILRSNHIHGVKALDLAFHSA